jgi:hypothetical protein
MVVTFRTLFMILMIVLISGCTSRQAGPRSVLQEQIGPMTYEIAIQVYQAGEYDKAAALFDEVAESTNDPLLEGKARFGRISSLLVGAATEKEYETALASWEAWSSEVGGSTPETDPRLLPPIMAALEKRAGRSVQPPPRPAQPAVKQVPDNTVLVEVEEMRRLQQSIQDRQEENANLRERLAALETSSVSSSSAVERLRLNESLREREHENSILREKISALESTISEIHTSRYEELQKVPEEEVLRMVDIVEEKERENQALRERLSALEEKLSGEVQERTRQAQQTVPPNGRGAELSRENQQLKEKLEALESLHQEMLERKRTLYEQ